LKEGFFIETSKRKMDCRDLWDIIDRTFEKHIGDLK